MLDDMQAAFAAEMTAQAPLRPASTRHRAEIDTLSGAGAARLARVIQGVWNSLGFDVQVDVVPFAAGKGAPAYGIRSNLINGLPRGPSCVSTENSVDRRGVQPSSAGPP